jgi:signal transduction histidine kinase
MAEATAPIAAPAVAPGATDKLAVLRQVFDALGAAELAELAAVMRVAHYPAGSLLSREGALEDTLYILAAGEVVITRRMGGEERVLRRAGPGDDVGVMALIQNARRAADVRAISDCAALEMSKADFDLMLERNPRLAIALIRGALARMRSNDLIALQDLQHTNRVLAQLDRNKLEFIEVAAHELRTPLTVMKGYLNVLKLNESLRADDTLREVLEGLSRGTERLHEIVNTMLDVTRVDSDAAAGVRLALVPVPLKSVVNDIAHRLSQEARDRRLSISIEHDPATPIIQADPTLLQKALYHIIVNAIKYTPDGGQIAIHTRPVALAAGLDGAEISVRDTGIGIAAEHCELIFEKFYQVGAVALHSSGKTVFKGGGPGLGLAIARGVVRAHGGKIWVESPGQDEAAFPGSTFYIQLPGNPPGR